MQGLSDYLLHRVLRCLLRRGLHAFRAPPRPVFDKFLLLLLQSLFLLGSLRSKVLLQRLEAQFWGEDRGVRSEE